jgi:S-adenosylmethionine hydrolase
VKHPVIAMLTDFGAGDFFVGSLKGVITGILPAARIIDITHDIPSFNIKAAAFVLRAAYRFFPAGTVFLSVVDPGVGSDRKVILIKTQDYFYIAPDNGILDPTLQLDPAVDMCEVTVPDYYLPDVSHTFEARDRMAPVAAWLASGVPLKKFGPVLPAYKKLAWEDPEKSEQSIQGEVLYADKFGNLITNIPVSWLDEFSLGDRSELNLTAGGKTVQYQNSYAEADRGERLYLPGSLGLIEIAVREGSAAVSMSLGPGDQICIERKA